MTLQNFRLEICHRPGRIGLNVRLTVLHHKLSVLIVVVDDGERTLWQSVEERLLGITVVLYRLMIVKMVTGEIRKYTTNELQSADTLLCYSMTGALHEGILTTCINHSGEESVKLYGVGGSMTGGNSLIFYVVADR